MSFIRHRAPGFWTPQRVPSGPVEIDWTHPLAQGLVACYVPGGAAGVADLCGHAPLSLASGLIASGWNGPTLITSGTGTAPNGPVAQGGPFQISQGTMFWRGVLPSLPPSGSTDSYIYMQTLWDSGSNAPYYGFANQYGFLSFGWQDPYGAASTGAASAVLTAGVPISWAIAFDPTTALTSEFYIDGVLLETSATANGIAYSGTSGGAIYLGGGASGQYGFAATDIGVLYNQVLGADLIAWLDAEPFAMLRPAFVPRRRTPSVPRVSALSITFAIT